MWPFWKAIFLSFYKCLKCSEIKHFGNSAQRNAWKQQSFSGPQKHFSALTCIFFFPLPGLFPNRGVIEFTCKKVPCASNASSDLCSQTLIYWLSRTRVPLPSQDSETPPSPFHKRSLSQTSTTSESLQPESFMTRSVWLMFDAAAPLASWAYIRRTCLTTRHILTKILKGTKWVNREHPKPFC